MTTHRSTASQPAAKPPQLPLVRKGQPETAYHESFCYLYRYIGRRASKQHSGDGETILRINEQGNQMFQCWSLEIQFCLSPAVPESTRVTHPIVLPGVTPFRGSDSGPCTCYNPPYSSIALVALYIYSNMSIHLRNGLRAINNRICRILVLHVSSQGSFPNTTYGSTDLPGESLSTARYRQNKNQLKVK